MEKVSPTAARIVKKSLWRDIQRWVNEEYQSGPIEIDTCSKKKILSRTLELTKKKDGDFYAGAILVEVSRLPSRNSFLGQGRYKKGEKNSHGTLIRSGG